MSLPDLLTLARVCRTALALALIGSCGDSPANEVLQPKAMPFVDFDLEIPDDATLQKEMEEAIETKRGSAFDRDFDALDPGELLEHATYSQLSIDSTSPSLAALFTKGDELFEYAFRVENGLGNALAGSPGVRGGNQPAPNMRRIHKSDFGGPDSYSCVTCHSKGGPDGAGTNTQNAYFRGNGKNALTADERNAPHLLGLGPVEALAREMSGILGNQKAKGIALAKSELAPQRITLSAKGVDFGTIFVGTDGTVDTSEVSGIDADLIVRPFGWKGHQASIRGMSEESFRLHMGILSSREQQMMKDGELDVKNYGNGIWFDLDKDNHHIELDSGMLTSMVVYLSQLEVPVVRRPKDKELGTMFDQGQDIFVEIGCATCHRPSLILNQPILPIVPKDKRYTGRAPILVNVASDGEEPKIKPHTSGGFEVALFSDLRRHDMGDKLTSGYKQGHLPKSHFLTRPLWGLADTAPFLHDGRAPTLHDAIQWHGGEAADASEKYQTLDKASQRALLVFLLSLDREPTLVVP